jgi:CDP-4-dehydro-6-deoxyglucose reductase
VRRPRLYQIEHWDEWLKLPNLFLHKVVSDLCGWEGRCGMLHEAVCEDFPDLKALHVYASGSPAMVYGTLDALVEAGWTPIRCAPTYLRTRRDLDPRS